jgi:hypothetical protein
VIRALAAGALGAACMPAWARTGGRTGAGAMIYRYWDWGKTPKRDDYQVAVLNLALKKTVDAYGPFRVLRVVEDMSTVRLRREVHAGKRINVHVGPWRDQNAGNPEERNHLIDIPVMGGLLGYRRLIARTEDLSKFKLITNETQLKKLVAGQGRGWEDVAVLRHNGYRVEDSGNLATLFDMLANKRFDYLPVSVAEAESALARHAHLADQVALVPGLLLYYPLPSMYYVSAAEPELAARLEAGMAVVKKDGSLAELTVRYFEKEIQQLKSGDYRHYVLSNPVLPKKYAEPPLLLVR